MFLQEQQTVKQKQEIAKRKQLQSNVKSKIE